MFQGFMLLFIQELLQCHTLFPSSSGTPVLQTLNLLPETLFLFLFVL
jgi:hypothetical protein